MMVHRLLHCCRHNMFTRHRCTPPPPIPTPPANCCRRQERSSARCSSWWHVHRVASTIQRLH